MNLFDFDENEKKQKSPLGFELARYDYIVGTDEAGRGPAAGGVWAAAVCFFNNIDKTLFLKLNDSKKLTPNVREELFFQIIKNSFYSIKVANVDTIEEINILNASLNCMKRSIKEVENKIKTKSYLALIDGNKLIKDSDFQQKTIIKGDMKSASIAAASILAKVARDKYMDKIAEKFPMYDWKSNKGYLTKKHIDSIKKYGVCSYHRLSFLKNIIKTPS